MLQEEVHGLVEGGAGGQRLDGADGGGADGKVAGAVAHRDVLRFGGRGQVDEQADDDQHRAPEQAGQREQEGGPLPDPRGDPGRLRVRPPHGEKGAQNATAVHGKGGEEVEEDEEDVGAGEPGDEADPRILQPRQVLGPAARGDEHQERRRDRHVHGGAGERHHQLLAGLFGDALQGGDAADRPQRHLGGADAVAAGGGDVAELVGEHAGEQEEDVDDALDRRPPAPRRASSSRRPRPGRAGR